MKRNILTFVLVIASFASGDTVKSSSSKEAEPAEVAIGTMMDSRDGSLYNIVSIGSQTWMAENLSYVTPDSYCYNDDTSYCVKYGRLYTWSAAKMACPNEWHLPTKSEWMALFSVVGDSSTAGAKLKSMLDWNESKGKNEDRTDAFRFNAFPAGYRNGAGISSLKGDYAFFWSSTEGDGNIAYRMRLESDNDNASLYGYSKDYGFSVRCLKGEALEQIPSSGTMTDSRDGKIYKTVTIGTQVWMAENVNYGTYGGGGCYGYDENNCSKYGRLYTWDTAKYACPGGWHLPSKAEWDSLFATVGNSSLAGAKLKSMFGWFKGGNGTDAFGFSALPGGYGGSRRNYYAVGRSAHFWSSTEYDSDSANVVSLGASDDRVYMEYDIKSNEFSVRCLQGESLEQISSHGTMTDSRDGKKYKTLTIGTQTWMAENLNYKTLNSRCNNKDNSKCSKYGRLYDEFEGLCPAGWSLPTFKDVSVLLDAVGGVLVYISDFEDWEGGSYSIWDAYTSEKLRSSGFIDKQEGPFYAEDRSSWSCDSGSCKIMTSPDPVFVRCIKEDLVSAVDKLMKQHKKSDNNVQKNLSITSEEDLISVVNKIMKMEKKDKKVQKSLPTTSVIPSSSPVPVSAEDVVVGSFRDSRDGHTYKSVKIGSQTWMAEDLKYKGGYYSWAEAVGSPANKCGAHHVCGLNGTVRGVCPEGWHLPSKYDFDTLIAAVGGKANAASVLMSDSIDWSGVCESFRFTNDYGFSAVPNGFINYLGGKKDDGISIYFWSSTEGDMNRAYYMYMGIDSVVDYDCEEPPGIGVGRGVKYDSYSVRCLQD